jgi:hypothetical protein
MSRAAVRQSERCLPAVSHSIVFRAPKLAQHSETVFQLDVGTLPAYIRVDVLFNVLWEGIGPAPDALVAAGEALVYASDTWHDRVCDYPYLRSVSLADVKPFLGSELNVTRPPQSTGLGRPKAPRQAPAVKRPPSDLPLLEGMDDADNAPVRDEDVAVLPTPALTDAAARQKASSPKCGCTTFRFASVSGTLFIAVFAPVALSNIQVICHSNVSDSDALGVTFPFDDDLTPWGIAKQYVVTVDSFNAALKWFHAKRPQFVVGAETLMDPRSQSTPLHVACTHCGDPKLVRLMLERLARFIDVNARNVRGQTALMCLLSRRQRCDPRDSQYHRTLELVELLVRQCGVNLDAQDINGDTVVHYAARGYRRQSRLLSILIECGATTFQSIRNEKGRTATEECAEFEYGLLPSEVMDVERAFVGKVGVPLVIRSLPIIDRLPPVEFSSSSQLDRVVPPLAVIVDGRGLPMASADEDRSSLRPDDAEATGTSDRAALAVHKRSAAISTKILKRSVTDRNAPPLLNMTKLREEFDRLDVNKDGWLSRGEMREAYCKYDSFGVAESAMEIDALVDSLGIARDGKVTFDEFVLLILKLSRR